MLHVLMNSDCYFLLVLFLMLLVVLYVFFPSLGFTAVGLSSANYRIPSCKLLVKEEPESFKIIHTVIIPFEYLPEILDRNLLMAFIREILHM